MFPLLSRNFHQLCPISVISQKFAITTSELSKLEIYKLLELDIQTPIDEIGSIIKDISYKC